MKRLLSTVISLVAFISVVKAAESYPSAPIRMVVPFAAGGPTDAVARTIARQMSSTLGSPIVVDNKPGADSTIGTAEVARAAADGHTLLFTTSSFVLSPLIYPKLSYDPNKDFIHLGVIGTQYEILAVPSKSKYISLNELILDLKKEPARFNYGTSGSTIHLISALFHDRVGAQGAVRINYKGNSPMLNGFLTGEMDYGFLSLDGSVEHIKGGAIKPLAVTSPTRDRNLPSVPTMEEAGVKDFNVGVWFSMHVRQGTPENVVKKIQSSLELALRSNEVKELSQRYAGFYIHEPLPVEAVRAFMNSEWQKWAPIANEIMSGRK